MLLSHVRKKEASIAAHVDHIDTAHPIIAAFQRLLSHYCSGLKLSTAI